MDFEEKVIQFVSVTGSSDSIARKFLEACAGDIDMAIGMHLESQVNTVDASGIHESKPAAPPTDHVAEEVLSPKAYEKAHGVRAPIPQTTGVLIGDDAQPPRKLRSRLLPHTVFDPFQDYSAVGSRIAHSSKHGSEKDKQNLAEIFRPPHDLLFNGTFHEAKLAGQQRMRWLLVNLQDSKEFASQTLNRDVWSNYHIKDLVKRYFIFMQIYRISDEGVQFKHLYHIDSYPSVAIIDPRTGEKMISLSASSADSFLQEVSEFLANNPYEEEGQGDQQHMKSIINLSEESQLEAAITASLQESEPQNSDNHTIIFSDDSDTDYISLSPGRKTEDPPCSLSDVRSVGKSSLHTEEMNSNDRNGTEAANCFNGVACSSADNKSNKTRKRPSNNVDGGWSGKKRRTDVDPVCTAMDNIELTRSLSEEESVVPKKPVNGKGRAKGGKGKGKAGGGHQRGAATIVSMSEDTMRGCSVEELLTAGDICKGDISIILFRLPDGTRLQKTFLSNHPIRELFKFLEGQGLKVAEHAIETHFPKRSLLAMDQDTSLKHNGLYPRETVFISTV